MGLVFQLVFLILYPARHYEKEEHEVAAQFSESGLYKEIMCLWVYCSIYWEDLFGELVDSWYTMISLQHRGKVNLGGPWGRHGSVLGCWADSGHYQAQQELWYRLLGIHSWVHKGSSQSQHAENKTLTLPAYFKNHKHWYNVSLCRMTKQVGLGLRRLWYVGASRHTMTKVTKSSVNLFFFKYSKKNVDFFFAWLLFVMINVTESEEGNNCLHCQWRDVNFPIQKPLKGCLFLQ